MDLKKGAEYKGEFGEQMSQLQNLVDQMKEGFIQAMEELSRVQDGDRLLQQEVKDHKQETDKKVEELTTCVHQIRADLSSVLKEVQKSNKETGRLAEQFESLRREHGRMRRKLKQNERNIENQRQKEQRPSISQSTKSEGDANKSDTNHKTAPNDNLLRRRKSTPAAYSNLKGARECRSVLPLEAQTPMAPMMQPFIDSLPDPGDLNNNDGNTSFDLLEGDDSRQYTTQRSGGSSNSSGNDTKEREQTSKAFSPGRRVSFSTVDQTHSSSDDPEGQRIQVAEEFLSSERKYVGQLNALLDNIMLPLVTESLIHPSDINVIFPPSLAKMFDRHCCLLCALETRLSDALWQGMHGDIFAKFAGPESSSFLSQYGSYISSFPESLSLLSHHTRKSAKLTNFLKKQLADIEDEQADLLGYLLAPIQRIPAYVLHLKTVLEVTDSDHPDHFHMESCLTHLGSFLATMNPAIEQAVEAARTHILFLSETKGSLAFS
ncbi:rho guanine nucleotide exchange factor 33-like, partial [Acanthaster planci]|uniref:Rho guanine nucleotide exchange factor 33-like n=1 Tax=Acanthaster planci TaxID=133434 RepID=A0A8B7ZDD5_ACAPL